jgi:hypothetical protein
MQSSLKIAPYRAIIERGGPPEPYDALLDDLCRCAAECGWSEGSLALYGSGSDVPLLVTRFRGGALRLLPWQVVALALVARGGGACRLLVKAWPRSGTAESRPVAAWEWSLTRVLPPAAEPATHSTRIAVKEKNRADPAGR